MTNPRHKGSKFERDIARRLGVWAGIELARTPLSGGMTQSFPADIMPKDRGIDFTIMVECKHQECWDLDLLFKWPDCKELVSWWNQCMKATHYMGRKYIPLLIAKRNRYPAVAIMRISDVHELRTSNVTLLDLHGKEPLVVMLLDEFLARYRYADF